MRLPGFMSGRVLCILFLVDGMTESYHSNAGKVKKYIRIIVIV